MSNYLIAYVAQDKNQPVHLYRNIEWRKSTPDPITFEDIIDIKDFINPPPEGDKYEVTIISIIPLGD